jgi:VWFA-related protein
MYPRAALIAVLCSFMPPAYGQAGDPAVTVAARRTAPALRSAPSNLRLDVKVILVPVSVADAEDHPVTNLSQESFRVLEDGVEQKIRSFAREDGPVSLGLLFDTSGSMKGRVDASIEALKEFFQTIIPGDEFFLIQFSDQAQLLSRFTTDPEHIFERLGVVQPRGWTALLDAVALGTHQMRSARNRSRVLLVLSDGADNNSRFSASEVKNIVMEGDVRVYAVCLRYHAHLLQQLANETGGKVLTAQNMSELPDVVNRLAVEIRSQYVLGYSSNADNDGKYHKVKIELVQPPGAAQLRASWRHGYYAPLE